MAEDGLGGGGRLMNRTNRRIPQLREAGRRWLATAGALLARWSDADAYQRYLQRTGQRPGASSWRGFLDERHAPSARRMRCC